MLDSDDPVKGQLLRKSAHHREQLEEDVKLISERTEKIITNALIIGGALAAAYFIVNRFSSSTAKSKTKVRKVRLVKEGSSGENEVVVSEEEPKESGVIAQIGSALAGQATVFLLSLAKEKLAEFMQSQNQKKEKADDNS